MNEDLKEKILKLLRIEAENIMGRDKDIHTKLAEMNDVFNITKILENYEELEPVLKNFFIEKSRKEKFERGN